MWCHWKRKRHTLLRLIASKNDFPAKSLSESWVTRLSSPWRSPAEAAVAPSRLQLKSIAANFLRFLRRRIQTDEMAPGPIEFPLSMRDSRFWVLQACKQMAVQPSSPRAFSRRSRDLSVLFIVKDFANETAPSFPILLLLKFKCESDVVGDATTLARAWAPMSPMLLYARSSSRY